MSKSPTLTLIIDSREQKPLAFSDEAFDSVRTDGLPFADYWAELNGKEIPLVYERKGFGDLWGTMVPTKSNPDCLKRFKRELAKAKEQNVKIVLLIEGSLRKVSKGFKRSKFSGKSMRRLLNTLCVKYDLEFHYCNDREEMAITISDMFNAIKRNFKTMKKADSSA